jgi:arylsulfatase A-like enzyme
MAGKFLVSWPGGTAPPNFDRYATIKGGYNDYYAFVNGQSRHIVRTNSAPRNYSTIWLGDRLREYIHGFEANDDRPWFAYYTPQAPHVSATGLAVPEPRYATAPVGTCLKPNETDRSDKPPYVRWISYDAARYKAICESQIRTLMTVDDVMNDIFLQLQTDGELANTLVIFMSDNGHLWGEHGRTSKFVPYLPSVRVPLLVRWDGQVSPGVDNRLAVNVDIAPTVLEAAGVTVPAGKPPLDGQSLLRPSTRTVLFTEYFQDSANGSVWTWASLYDGNMHYIENTKPDGVVVKEYYDLVADPAENLNLLGDRNQANDPPAAVLTALAARLALLRTASGPGMVQ